MAAFVPFAGNVNGQVRGVLLPADFVYKGRIHMSYKTFVIAFLVIACGDKKFKYVYDTLFYGNIGISVFYIVQHIVIVFQGVISFTV